MDDEFRRDLASALLLQLDWGVDEALLDAPLDRLAALAAARAARAAGPPPDALPPAAAPAPRPARPALVPAADPAAAFTPALSRAGALAAAATDLAGLRQAIAEFDHPLRETATNLVFGDGRPDSGLVFVGEAPGGEEDRLGRPFVGPSGQLLDRMLASIGIARDAADPRDGFYITNILPWRPPGNRTPADTEINIFIPFVLRHIELIRPRRVVFLGGTSAKALLQSKEGITRLRGRWLKLAVGSLGEVPALATLHPAYLLRSPAAKRDAWTDLLLLRRSIDADRGGQ
jgi:uracil-DNA glycosylase family 4